MCCDSSRSMLTDATRMAMPSAIHPIASAMSERGGMRSSPCSSCGAVSATGGGASLMGGNARSGLRNADRIGAHLRLATFVQHPGVELDRRKHGLLRSVTVQRVEQRTATGGVLLQRLAIDDLLGPDALERLDHLIGHTLGNENAEVIGGRGETGK